MANKRLIDVESTTTLNNTDSVFINGGGVVKQTTISNLNIISMKLLWENASPSSIFTAQTINLDLSNYSHILIIYSAKYWNGDSESKGRKSVVVQVGDTAVLNNGSMANSSSYYVNNTA